MQKEFLGIIRLVLTFGICALFIAVAFSSAIVKSADTQVNQTMNESNPPPSKNPVPSFLRFFIHDWNWWDNKPNMFSIPAGNVGIGITTPDDRLDVVGIIHSSLGGFKFPDNTTQTSAAFGDGHSLDASDGSPADAVYVDNNGNVGIGTTTPTTKLDIQGGNASIDGFQVCTFVGVAHQTANLTLIWINSSIWYDLPGVIINFSLSTAKWVDLRAFGVQYHTGNAICFRYTIDGEAFGDPLYGDLYTEVYSGGYIPWNFERIVSIPAGQHSAKLQICMYGGTPTTFYATDYWGARMFVFAW